MFGAKVAKCYSNCFIHLWCLPWCFFFDHPLETWPPTPQLLILLRQKSIFYPFHAWLKRLHTTLVMRIHWNRATFATIDDPDICFLVAQSHKTCHCCYDKISIFWPMFFLSIFCVPLSSSHNPQKHVLISSIQDLDLDEYYDWLLIKATSNGCDNVLQGMSQCQNYSVTWRRYFISHGCLLMHLYVFLVVRGAIKKTVFFLLLP